MTLLTRRGLLAGAAAAAARPRRKHRCPTVAMKPDEQGIFPFLLVGGAGDASGVFVYDPQIAQGDLIASMTDALTSPTGDTTRQGITSYNTANGTVAQLNSGQLFAGVPATDGALASFAAGGGEVTIGSGLGPAAGSQAILQMTDSAFSQSDFIFAQGPPSTPFDALVEMQGISGRTTLQLVPAAAGNSALAVQLPAGADDVFHIDGAGGLNFGSGAAPTDASIHHLAANSLSVKGGDWSVETIGRGLRVREGSNAKQGRATLVAGSVIVANTSITATSIIVPGYVTPSANAGAVFVSSVTVGTGFTLKSTNAADTGVVGYQIFEQA